MIKAIISHDVDHLSYSEHWRDLVVPKMLLRTVAERVLGYTTAGEARARAGGLVRNQMQRIEAVMDFDERHGVPATFFVAVARGRGLSYAADDSRRWLERIRARGFRVGLHAIAYHPASAVADERRTFAALSGLDRFGVRLHNVGMLANGDRIARQSGAAFRDAGFAFTSHTYSSGGPYRIAGLWEIPLQLTDGVVFARRARMVSTTLSEAQDLSRAAFVQAVADGLPVFNVLFHDLYFSPAFQVVRDWYQWLIEFLAAEGVEFIDYEQALGLVRDREPVA